MENNLQNQLKEIREKGALNVGFYSQIFKDKHFDNAFVYGEIMPQIVAEGFFENENRCNRNKYKSSSSTNFGHLS